MHVRLFDPLICSLPVVVDLLVHRFHHQPWLCTLNSLPCNLFASNGFVYLLKLQYFLLLHLLRYYRRHTRSFLSNVQHRITYTLALGQERRPHLYLLFWIFFIRFEYLLNYLVALAALVHTMIIRRLIEPYVMQFGLQTMFPNYISNSPSVFRHTCPYATFTDGMRAGVLKFPI